MRFLLSAEPELGNWYSKWPILEKAVVEADRLGYWGFGMPDEYQWMPQTVPKTVHPDETLDTWIALTHLAAKTEHIRMGTMVTPIPLRPPAQLAKIVSTLDILSEGRVFLGVGAGYSRRDFDGYAEWDRPRVRVDKTEEAVQLIKKLWTEKEVSYKGRYYKAENAVLEPKPIQKPHPLLLFGGFKPRMQKLAGRYADIANSPPPFTKIDPAEARRQVEEEARKHGREDKISFIYGVYEPTYDAKGYAAQLEEAKKYDCDPVLVLLSGDYLESMRNFARDIVPSFGT